MKSDQRSAISRQPKYRQFCVMCVFIATNNYAYAQDTTAPAQAPERQMNAPQAVRRGNQLLSDGDAVEALLAYDRAKELRPDAREVAFAQGLAHYDLGEFDEARSAFLHAATTANDELADDARYSLATCDHAEALMSQEDPQQSISRLEDAMRQYQNVMANRPDHREARASNYKAASLWRQIKRMLEQQQQQQQQQGDDNNEDQEKEDQENQDQQPSEDQKNQDQQQDQQQQDQDQQQQQSNDDQQDKEQQQQAAAEKEERVSREQAERKLREMMQELRDRQKKRPKPVQRIPVSPVEKDW